MLRAAILRGIASASAPWVQRRRVGYEPSVGDEAKIAFLESVIGQGNDVFEQPCRLPNDVQELLDWLKTVSPEEVALLCLCCECAHIIGMSISDPGAREA